MKKRYNNAKNWADTQEAREWIHAQDWQGFTALMWAIEFSESPEIVERLFQMQPDFMTIRNAMCKTALMLAEEKNNSKIIEILCRHIDFEKRDSEGRTFFIEAVEKKYINILSYLLQYKRYLIKDKDDNHRTALMRAVREENTDMINLLLKHQAPLEAENNLGISAFLSAINRSCYNNTALLACFFNHEYNINRTSLFEQTDPHGRTPLMLACWSNNLKVVQFLLAQREFNTRALNAQDKSGLSALMYAVIFADFPIIQELFLHKNLNLNLQDQNQNIALIHAAQRGDEKIWTAIHNQNPDLKLTNHIGFTTKAYRRKQKPTETISKAEATSIVDHFNNNGETPLIAAARCGDLEKVKAVFVPKKHTNYDTNPQQRTPLMVAVLYHQTAVVDFFFSQGAPLEPRDIFGKTAFLYAIIEACTHNDTEILSYFFKNNKSVNLLLNTMDTEQRTPLMVACIYQNLSVVNFLLKHNPNLGAQDFQGKTAFIHASESTNPSIIAAIFKQQYPNSDILYHHLNTASNCSEHPQDEDSTESVNTDLKNIIFRDRKRPHTENSDHDPNHDQNPNQTKFRL